MDQKNLFILDGNGALYRSFYAIPNLKNASGFPTNAIFGFLKLIFKLANEHKIDYFCVCFDAARKTFRQDLYPDYKAHRKETPADLVPQMSIISEILDAMKIKSFKLQNYEADDIIATIANKAETNLFIVSSDKDVIQLINSTTKVLPLPKTDVIDETFVLKNYGFMPENITDFLAITGDKSDNVPGIKGIGDEGAKFLIQKYGKIEKILENLETVEPKYKKKLAENENIEILKLSKKLVELDTNVPIDFDLQNCVFDKKNFDNPDFLKFLRNFEFNSLVRELQNFSKKLQIPQNNHQTKKIAEILFEDLTENLDEASKNESFSITFSEDAVFVFDLKEKIYKINTENLDFELTKLKPFFSNAKNFYTDNSKFLFKFLKKLGLDSKKFEIFDVVLAAYILDMSSQNLEAVLQKYLGKNSDKISHNEKVQNIFEVAEKIKDELKKQNLNEIYKNIELKFSKVLAEIEENGIKIDLEYLQKFRNEITSNINKIVAEAYKISGAIFNLNSPKQLAEILFVKLNLPTKKKSKTGFSTSEEVLTELVKIHELPRIILKYRELNKILTTYIEPIFSLVGKDSRLRTHFNYTNTNTGRLSSSNPNLQNIPQKSEISSDLRKAFIANDGNLLVSFDYSQIDLAVLADMSGDEIMLRTFQNHDDIHKITASYIFSKPTSEITKDERNVAKKINFSLIYGKSAFGLADELGISFEEAKNFIDLYFQNYRQMKTFIGKTIENARKNGFVSTIFGRKRFVTELQNKNVQMQKFGERIAINTPIQGTSADIIKKAMTDLYEHFEEENNIKILLQIHDEILFEIKESCLEDYSKIITKIMENAVKLKVPLKVNMKKGKNWAELE